MHLRSKRGIALLLALFIIALGSIVVLNVTETTYISSRLNKSFEQEFKAEFYLKSAINASLALIASTNSQQDPPPPPTGWSMFTKGTEVPLSMIGINDPNTTVSLEIVGEGKLPLDKLEDRSGSGSGISYENFINWRDTFTRLFKDHLGFDQDNEKDETGLFKGRVFRSEELVANLIDYIDADTESYSEGGFAQGIEKELPNGAQFKNKKIESITELYSIPGFTQKRVKLLAPYVTATQNEIVNINFAPKIVLQSLDPDVSDSGAEEIRKYVATNGGYDSTNGPQLLSQIMPKFQELNGGFITFRNSHLIVTAKVTYGDARYFVRSVVRKSSGGTTELPKVLNMEFFG